MTITTVGLDADDTLWHNETLFRLTHKRFTDLLSPHCDEATLEARLAETEKRNLRLYGYGVKGFTLSMIETAMELTDGAVETSVIREILAAGREMLTEPVEPLPGVDHALALLSERYRLVLITKGAAPGTEAGGQRPWRPVRGGRDRQREGRRHLPPRLRPPWHRSGAGGDGRQLDAVGRHPSARGRLLGRADSLSAGLGPRSRRRTRRPPALCGTGRDRRPSGMDRQPPALGVHPSRRGFAAPQDDERGCAALRFVMVRSEPSGERLEPRREYPT
jgi:hypothetical protein